MEQQKNLKKSVIVTGGAKGIGKSISSWLAKDGYDLFICGRDQNALTRFSDGLTKAYPVLIQTAVADLSTMSSIKNLGDLWLTDRVSERVPSHVPPHILPQAMICNAGDYGTLGNFENIDLSAWQKSFDLNFFSVAQLMQIFIQYVRKQVQLGQAYERYQLIILSGSGLGGSEMHQGITAYGCAKGALYRLMELVSCEVRDLPIEINCLAPGFVKTGITQQAVTAGNKLGKLFEQSQKVLQEGGTSPDLAAETVSILLSETGRGVSGRLISAKWDRALINDKVVREKIKASPDLWRLRRIDNELFKEAKAT